MRKIWTKNIRMLLLVALSCILLAGCEPLSADTAVQSNELGTSESQPVGAEVQSKAVSTDGDDIALHIAFCTGRNEGGGKYLWCTGNDMCKSFLLQTR